MAHPELRKLHDVVEKGNKEVVAQSPREDRNTAKNAMQIDSSGEKEDKTAKGNEANKTGHSQTTEIETHEDTEGWQTVPKGRGRNRTNKSTNVFTDQQTSNNETMHMKDDETKVTAMCEESTAKATIPQTQRDASKQWTIDSIQVHKNKIPHAESKNDSGYNKKRKNKAHRKHSHFGKSNPPYERKVKGGKNHEENNTIKSGDLTHSNSNDYLNLIGKVVDMRMDLDETAHQGRPPQVAPNMEEGHLKILISLRKR
ncbi:hypothetical protein H5410_064333 [Solanum commersonii]|uniref:Uncharacterized protein n=1 Tax=Solanum commersonii TaxID=4109 RepID=A0A9J5VZM1_SOLCO|nr:hypothetical protein H5410_064333 [Solanum commersonii]